MFHSWVEVSREAILNNYDRFANLSRKTCLVAPVLKSNAYGHGLELMAKTLKVRKPSYFCVNYVGEGLQLRSSGSKTPIMVAGPSLKEEFAEAGQKNLEIFIRDFSSLEAWTSMRAKKPKIHLKFDTGMNRQGFLPRDASLVANRVKEFIPYIAGVCSHFSNVEDVEKHDFADLQLSRFAEIREFFPRERYKKTKFHIASSASALIFPKARLDLVRVGISSYGIWPSQMTRLSHLQIPGSKSFKLMPALRWCTTIGTLKDVSPGDFVGYGCTYRAVSKMRLAILPVGYFEGYPRLAGMDKSYVLIAGKRCAIIGRICMNMMMVDVSHIPKACIGMVATLIGKDKSEEVTADDLAAWSQTISYELLSRIHPGIERRVV